MKKIFIIKRKNTTTIINSIIEDIQGAQQTGMKAVLKGNNHQKIEGIIPDAEIIKLYEIIEFLDKEIQTDCRLVKSEKDE